MGRLKIAILTVTYNRKECLKRWIKTVMDLEKSQYADYYYYIVDNCSSDGTYELINELKNKDIIKYFKLDENNGGAGGFSYGMKQAMQDDMDVVWGMDDDAYPEKNALKILIDFYNENNSCLYSNSNHDHDFNNGSTKMVRGFMFVGFFIPKEVILKIGYPRSDFFIYHDDSEYSYRITRNGYHIYKVKDSIINHRNGIAKILPSKIFLVWTIELYDLPNWKMYYFIRNAILRYSYSDLRYYKNLVCYVIPYFFLILYVNPKQLPIYFKALLHGFFRISGKKMNPKSEENVK